MRREFLVQQVVFPIIAFKGEAAHKTSLGRSVTNDKIDERARIVMKIIKRNKKITLIPK